MTRWKYCPSTTFESLSLSTCTLCQQKSYISKLFNQFSKSLPELEAFEGGHFRGKFQVRRYFSFCNGKVKTLRIDNIWKFATFNLYTAPGKILYLQGYSTDFRNLRLSSEFLREGIWWKVSGAQVFYFGFGKVKTLRIDNIWKFATFNLYTVPGKILHIQRYSTDFGNLCPIWKLLWEGIWVLSFRFAGILLWLWQGENFAYRQHLKVCHFQPVHCARQNPTYPKVFNRFWKFLPHLETFMGGHLGVKF